MTKRIDSHQHFWNFDPARQAWISENMSVLKRDFGPEHLEPLLQTTGLDGCVAVQASESVEENTFLLDLAATYSFVRGIVGWVDLQSDGVGERLSYYKQFDKVRGFRHIIQDEPDIDFMLRPAFINGVGKLKNFDYTYDILIYPNHLPNVLQFVQRFPDQAFVIDHIAKPVIRFKQIKQWKEQLGAIAAFSNVYCKISGMVTEAQWHHWQPSDFRPYLDTVVDVFGTDRIMYGSDWPVCLLSSSYADVFNIVNDYFSTFSKQEQDNFFGLNAIRFYGL